MAAGLAALTLVGAFVTPANAQTGPTPGGTPPDNVLRPVCGEPVQFSWRAAEGPEPVLRYELQARNTSPGSVPGDWVPSDVSGWGSWSSQWDDRYEEFGALTLGAFEVGVTAIGVNGAGPTTWMTIPPCKPGPVTSLSVSYVGPDRVRVTWAEPPDAAMSVSKYEVYFNRAGWVSWSEDVGTTSVEVTVAAGEAPSLPQVRVAPRGGYASGPTRWFCDPPSRQCVNG